MPVWCNTTNLNGASAGKTAGPSAAPDPNGQSSIDINAALVAAGILALRTSQTGNSETGKKYHAINTGGGTYELRTWPVGSVLLLRLHGCASSPNPQSRA